MPGVNGLMSCTVSCGELLAAQFFDVVNKCICQSQRIVACVSTSAPRHSSHFYAGRPLSRNTGLRMPAASTKHGSLAVSMFQCQRSGRTLKPETAVKVQDGWLSKTSIPIPVSVRVSVLLYMQSLVRRASSYFKL